MYATLKRLYSWKGIKKDVLMHCKHCQTCAKQWVEKSKYIKDNFRPGCIPMEFISMDLVGRFTRTTSGHEYALTMICMLTGYMFCIPLKMKSAEEIVEKYLTHVTFTFGVSRKILSDNGTEFKNSLFEEVAKQLGIECKIYSPVYRPQANSRIEGFHKFLKECISMHLVRSLEWDDILPLAAAAHNWFPNEHSKEPSFFLMFRWDVVTYIYCQTHQTQMEIPWWHQRSTKDWAALQTLPNHSIQPTEGQGTLRQGSNPQTNPPAPSPVRWCCPSERSCKRINLDPTTRTTESPKGWGMPELRSLTIMASCLWDMSQMWRGSPPWIVLCSTSLIMQAWVANAHSQSILTGSLTFNGKQLIGHYQNNLAEKAGKASMKSVKSFLHGYWELFLGRIHQINLAGFTWHWLWTVNSNLLCYYYCLYCLEVTPLTKFDKSTSLLLITCNLSQYESVVFIKSFAVIIIVIVSCTLDQNPWF